MIRFKKCAACLLSAFVMLSASACSSDESAPSASSSPSSSSQEIQGGQVSSSAAVVNPFEEEKPKITVSYAISDAPATIDPALVLSNSLAGEFVYHSAEGLVRFYNNEIIAGIAESWKTEDNITFTFSLRNALWEDGMQITAQDFEYSIKRLLDPDTKAVLSDGALLIKNAMAYRAGNVSEDEIGVQAIDNRTLEITLEEAAPYFLEILASDTHFYPVRKDITHACGENFAKSAGLYLSSGPFRIATWDEEKITMEKNQMYWDANKVKIEQIVCYFVPDGATRAAMYASDDCNVYIEQLDSNADAYENSSSAVTGTLTSLVLNENSAALGNDQFRKALNLSIDRNALIENSIAGTEPATRFVPKQKLADGIDYAATYSVKTNSASADNNQAKTALNTALTELEIRSVSELDEIVFLCSDNTATKELAEKLMKNWRDNLGLTKIRLEALPAEEMIEKCISGEFDLYLQSTTGRCTDPYLTLAQYKTTALYNWSGWSDEAYDLLLAESNNLEGAERLTKLQECEQYLLDNGPAIPLYFRGFGYGFEENVSGVAVSGIGVPLQLIYAEIKN